MARPGRPTPPAFGGILAFNRPLDEATAAAINRRPSSSSKWRSRQPVTPEARAVLAAKQNLRVLQVPLGPAERDGLQARGWRHAAADAGQPRTWPRLNCASSRACSPRRQQMADLMFAWKVAKFVKSNAIVFCAGGMTLGVGAGQMSRVDSARIARIKAGHAGLSLAGSAVASDAFFPFRDGLDVVIDEGASCVIQPGGSDARRRGHRRGQRARRGDGLHRHPPLPALKRVPRSAGDSHAQGVGWPCLGRGRFPRGWQASG
jgi:phosphoribosylaminoimidazolecarboxamide formyltransferase/IMP cyclohydrolase